REIGARQCREHFLGHFLGRDHAPGIDPAVLIAADAPLHAGAAQPAVLIDLAVEIGVDLAEDLDAVLLETPDVHLGGVLASEIAADDLLAAVDQLDADALLLTVVNLPDLAILQLVGGRIADSDVVELR